MGGVHKLARAVSGSSTGPAPPKNVNGRHYIGLILLATTAMLVSVPYFTRPAQWIFLNADEAKYTRFRAAMLEQYIHLVPEGRWYVGAAHTDKELEEVIPAIAQSMKGIS